MSENENEEKQEEESEEETEEEESSEEESDDSDSEESSEEESESEWKARALKAEKLIAERKRKEKAQKKEAPKKQLEESDDDLRSEVENLKLSEQKRQFGYQNNLSPDEVDKVFQIDSSPSEKTLEDPFVKAGLEAIRRQKRVDENTPSSSPKTPLQKKKFRELSQNEKDTEWQKYMKQKGVTK